MLSPRDGATSSGEAPRKGLSFSAGPKQTFEQTKGVSFAGAAPKGDFLAGAAQKGVSFGAAAGGRKVGCAARDAARLAPGRVESTDFGGGWSLRVRRGRAVGYGESKKFAAALASSVSRDAHNVAAVDERLGFDDSDVSLFAVRGDVPRIDESGACGCTAVVIGGVLMKVPEKIFEASYIELVRTPNDGPATRLLFDAEGALRRWALLAAGGLDERRAGESKAWSGWSEEYRGARKLDCDSRVAPRNNPALREEWDWTFRTDYGGQVAQDSTFTAPPKLQDASPMLRPLVAFSAAPTCLFVACQGGESRATVPAAAWAAADSAAVEAASQSRPGLFEEEEEEEDEEPYEQVEIKLYEDFLSDLGIAKLTCAVRWRAGTWELRLRWFASLNPTLQPARGVAHCRLRDVYLWPSLGASTLYRATDERSALRFDMDAAETGGRCAADRIDDGRMAKCIDEDVATTHTRSLEALTLKTEDKLVVRAARLAEADPLVVAPARVALWPSPRHVVDVVAEPGPSGRLLVAAADGALAVVDAHQCVWRNRAAAGESRTAARDLLEHRLEAAAWGPAGAPGESGRWAVHCTSSGEVYLWDVSRDVSRDEAAFSHDAASQFAVPPSHGISADAFGRSRVSAQCIAAAHFFENAAAGATVASGAALFGAVAAGRSVSGLALTFEAGAFRLALDATPRPPLPSVVVALAFAGGGDAASKGCLVASTASKGVYVWDDFSTTTPARHVPCGAAVRDLACAGGLFAGAADDRTVCVWPGRHALLSSKRFTLGGLMDRPDAHGGASAPSLSLVNFESDILVAVADGTAGAVVWRLDEDALDDAKLGVDTRRASRLARRAGHRALAVAFEAARSSDAAHACDAAPGDASEVRLAVAFDDGSVSIFTLAARSGSRRLRATLTATLAAPALFGNEKRPAACLLSWPAPHTHVSLTTNEFETNELTVWAVEAR